MAPFSPGNPFFLKVIASICFLFTCFLLNIYKTVLISLKFSKFIKRNINYLFLLFQVTAHFLKCLLHIYYCLILSIYSLAHGGWYSCHHCCLLHFDHYTNQNSLQNRIGASWQSSDSKIERKIEMRQRKRKSTHMIVLYWIGQKTQLL